MKQRNKNEYALIHHRKTSIGSDSIDNVHPFPICNGRYFLLQNGSSNAIHDWGIIHFLSEVKTHSDTYYLSKFIEEKGCNSLNDIAELLGKLIRSWVNLGVICVVDTSNDTILLLSDGCRSLHIDIDESETIINWFSSLTDKWDDDYFFKWFILLDFQWNIFNIKYEYLNKVVVKTRAVSTYAHDYQQGIPYANGYDPVDEYSSVKKKEESILQTLWDSINWKDEEKETWDWIDWIDPVLIVDSTDLQAYMKDFWETESDLAQRKNTWFGQGWVWDTLVSKLCTTANLISMEMYALVEDFYDTYQTQDIEYLWEYIEWERMNLMETVLEYEENFEYDE